jgi:hypothetical protein
VNETQEAQQKAEDSAVAWFVVLERARLFHNRHREAEAMRRLRELGVHVRYGDGPGETPR